MMRDGNGAGRCASILVGLAVLTVGFGSGIVMADPGRVEAGSVHSGQLGRSIPYVAYLPGEMGGPSARQLQSRAHVKGGRRYPVLYLLHGHGDDETTWLKLGKIRGTLDRLIAARELPHMIVVMPGADKSWYVDDARQDGAGFGPVFSALEQDFVAHIEARYPTLACREGRAIGGLSMGGYGAVLAGVTFPERFLAVISLSGSLFSPEEADFVARRAVYTRIFGGVFGEPPTYERFKAWNVFSRLAAVPDGVRVPGMFLSAGDDDFRSILSGTVRFHTALRRRGLESQLRVIDAGHDWANWRGEIVRALRWLGPRLARACARSEAVRRPGARCGGVAC